MATVNIAQMGSSAIPVQVPDGATVAEALAAANIQVGSSSEVFHLGTAVESLEQIVEDNATLVVARPVKGG